MFGIGMPELIVIILIALLVVGPKKLPELAKSIGKGLSEFKKAADDVTEGVKKSLIDDDEEKAARDDFKNSLLFGSRSNHQNHDASPSPSGEPVREKSPKGTTNTP